MNVAVPSGVTGVASSASTDIFASEAAIIKALSVVRQAAISPEAKNKLRDMFLRYVGESDKAERADLKKTITAELDKYPQLSILNSGGNTGGSTTGNSEDKSKTVETSRLGHTRPEPTFSSSAAAPPKSTETPTKAPTAPEVVAETAAEQTVPEAASIPKPETPPEPAAQPSVETTTSEPAPATTPQPATPAAGPPPAEPKPQATTPEPTPAPAPVGNTSNTRARIDEIKHSINGRVGNPVNLINANEKIGREYMSSLLEAMKTTSKGGGPEALERLETAYQAADQLIKSQGLTEAGPAATETQKTETPAAETPPEPTKPAVGPEVKPQAKTPTSKPTPTPSPEPQPTTPVAKPALEPTKPAPEPAPTQTEGLYHRPSDETEAGVDKPKPKSPAFRLSSLTSKLFKSEDDADKSVESPAAESTTPAQTNVRKVNVNGRVEEQQPIEPRSTQPGDIEDEKLQSLRATATALPEKMASLKAEAKKREEKAKKPITDLNSSEIDAGLKQLLAEWSLFKKSGFLGTGPSGIDHPLYKKLAPLPMAAVVSGRFEGSTPEIKQKLSAYMTGWRYEQGILHEMGEGFEHYLRRVIRKVIERQRTVVNV